jgi:hypothetical protein
MPFTIDFLDDGRVLEWERTTDGPVSTVREDYTPPSTLQTKLTIATSRSCRPVMIAIHTSKPPSSLTAGQAFVGHQSVSLPLT